MNPRRLTKSTMLRMARHGQNAFISSIEACVHERAREVKKCELVGANERYEAFLEEHLSAKPTVGAIKRVRYHVQRLPTTAPMMTALPTFLVDPPKEGA